MKRVAWPIGALLLLYVYSLYFEMPNRTVPLEASTALGCGLILMAFTHPRRCFGHLPTVFWWFLLFVAIDVFHMLATYSGGERATGVFKRAFYYFEFLFLFLITYNLFRSEAVARMALMALIAGAATVSLLLVTGLVKPVYDPTMGSRITAFGQNPNRMGGLMAMGFLALLGLFGTGGAAVPLAPRPRVPASLRLLVWPLLLVLAYVIVGTGSRGALLATGLGAVALFSVGGERRVSRPIGVQVRNLAILGLAMGGFAFLAMGSQSMRHRVEQAYQGGNLAGREMIFPSAWQMFLEKPLLGWGAVTSHYELASRVRDGHDARDPHNQILELLTATGIVGAIPFLIGMLICFAAAWRSRRGAHAALPLGLAVCTLSMNLSNNWLFFKGYWFVLAYVLASSTWETGA